MVSPEWFFSTLSQSTAAAIGFVIAFTASVFTLRNSIFQERVSEFRRDVGLLHSTYGPLLEATAEHLASEGDFESGSEVYINAHIEVEEWAETQPDPVTATIWAHLKMIANNISWIPEERDPEQIQIAFGMIEGPIQNLLNMLDHKSTYAENLIEERLDRELSKGRIDNQVIFRPDNAAKRKFERSSSSNTTSLHKLPGMRQVIADFQTDYNELNKRHGTKWLTDRPRGSIQVLSHSLKLFGVGVILPLVFLFSIPTEISSTLIRGLDAIDSRVYPYLVLSSQIGILVLVSVQTYNLYKALRSLIFSSSS